MLLVVCEYRYNAAQRYKLLLLFVSMQCSVTQFFVMEFYVSLTVHLGIILVINQYDALFSMYLLFHLSTCFEHLVLIIRRVKWY
jgi:hypothetical protein